jgi:hypothetical protein
MIYVFVAGAILCPGLTLATLYTSLESDTMVTEIHTFQEDNP